MQKPDTIRRRQLANLGFVGLLSPIIRLLPRQIVMIAGNAAWIAPLVATIPALFLILFMDWFLKNRLPGEGLGDLFLRGLGNLFGRIALLIFTLWLLFYAGFTVRNGADRFIATVYPNSLPWSFIVVMLLLSLMAILGRLQVLARTARVFVPMLLIAFAMIFAFCIPDMDVKNLMPVSYLDIDDILLAVIPVMNTISVFVYTGFLSGYTDDKTPLIRTYFKWTVLILIIISLLVVTALGIFGPELVTRISHLFLVMIRGISVTNLLERIEAVVIALWVVTDFILVSTFLFVCIENFHLIFGIKRDKRTVGPRFSLKNGRWLIWLCFIIVSAVAILIAPSSFSLYWLSDALIPFTNLIFVFVFLPIVCIIGKLRKKI
ncbi:MAG: GerAB/ArcD/ProY family transporter [Oscillospiraceae bacterium]|jgi:spore germination protein KB